MPAWEDVNVFDVRKGEKVGEWHVPGGRQQVVKICAAPRAQPEGQDEDIDEQETIFAVAYADGAIKLWSSYFAPSTSSSSSSFSNQAADLVTFNGHKTAPTSLAFSHPAGEWLFSGGTEGEIVAWDTLAEVGLFRLKGHRGPVTALYHLPHPDASTGSTNATDKPGFLLSVCKDGTLKLWDLGTRHCLSTVLVGRGQVLSLAVREVVPDELVGMMDHQDAERKWIVVTGSGGGQVKCWEITAEDLRRGLSLADNEVCSI